jgi:hypothetical protein
MWLRKWIRNKAPVLPLIILDVFTSEAPDTFRELDLELLPGRQTMTHPALALIPKLEPNLVIAFFGQLQSYCHLPLQFRRPVRGLRLLPGMGWRELSNSECLPGFCL